MAAITGLCNERFETVADFIRHLPRCVRCAMASAKPSTRRRAGKP